LKLLLRYLHPNLQRQKISYCIFIAEQFHDGRFNKKGFYVGTHRYKLLHFGTFLRDSDEFPYGDSWTKLERVNRPMSHFTVSFRFEARTPPGPGVLGVLRNRINVRRHMKTRVRVSL